MLSVRKDANVMNIIISRSQPLNNLIFNLPYNIIACNKIIEGQSLLIDNHCSHIIRHFSNNYLLCFYIEHHCMYIYIR